MVCEVWATRVLRSKCFRLYVTTTEEAVVTNILLIIWMVEVALVYLIISVNFLSYKISYF